MPEISALVLNAWTAIKPFLPILATAGVEEIGKRTVGDIWELIKKKFETKPTSKEAIDVLLKSPDDADVQGQFRAQLKKLLQEDSAFTAQLADLLNVSEDDYKAQVIGDGVIAQGAGAKAVSKNGILIEGDVSGAVNTGNVE